MNKGGLMIKVFGGLQIRYGDKTVGPAASASKSLKMWILFGYILLNRGRVLSQEELIEALWPNLEVANPANSLKVLIFKLRKELDQLGYLPGKEIIANSGGGYCFSDKVEYLLDVSVFERLIGRAEREEDEEERLKLILEAIVIYKGNVQPGGGNEPWLASLQTHYGDMYQRIVRHGAELLMKQSAYQKIVDICQNALLIQPYVEEYYYHLIQAYAAMENYSAATDMYVKVKEVMNQVYGITPDAQFEEAYKELMKQRPKRNLSAEELTERFKEENNYAASFYVEYGEFKQIYRLIARRLERIEGEAYMCLYTLGVRKGAQVDEAQRRRHLRLLGETLGFGLRRGDVFTRVTPNQFAAIFENLTAENAEGIGRRINAYFEKHKIGDDFGIIHRAVKIEPSSFECRFEPDNSGIIGITQK